MTTLTKNYIAKTDGLNPGGVSLFLRLTSYVKEKLGSDITTKVLKMNTPMKISRKTYQRRLKLETPENKLLLNAERELRKFAYKGTRMKCDDNFYSDADMNGEYYLVCVYVKNTYEVLLSARYYTNKLDIKAELEGSVCIPKVIDSADNLNFTWVDHELSKYDEGEIFLVDRMSGNIRHNRWDDRDFLKQKLYETIFRGNIKAKKFYALARKGGTEKLLQSYVRLGLKIIANTKYYGVDHWVLAGSWSDLINLYKRNKQYLGLMNSQYKLKYWKYKLNQIL